MPKDWARMAPVSYQGMHSTIYERRLTAWDLWFSIVVAKQSGMSKNWIYWIYIIFLRFLKQISFINSHMSTWSFLVWSMALDVHVYKCLLKGDTACMKELLAVERVTWCSKGHLSEFTEKGFEHVLDLVTWHVFFSCLIVLSLHIHCDWLYGSDYHCYSLCLQKHLRQSTVSLIILFQSILYYFHISQLFFSSNLEPTLFSRHLTLNVLRWRGVEESALGALQRLDAGRAPGGEIKHRALGPGAATARKIGSFSHFWLFSLKENVMNLGM